MALQPSSYSNSKHEDEGSAGVRKGKGRRGEGRRRTLYSGCSEIWSANLSHEQLEQGELRLSHSPDCYTISERASQSAGEIRGGREGKGKGVRSESTRSEPSCRPCHTSKPRRECQPRGRQGFSTLRQERKQAEKEGEKERGAEPSATRARIGSAWVSSDEEAYVFERSGGKSLSGHGCDRRRG
jgi:hypothetical protein